ncbi:protein canopy homolog 2-like [Actinia tenebrosa]|uniref:Protein canopy homolog 2-like n=1 Tax=Actinia tenebrosa TaxID=6105 RepID=A0A6P8I3I7_ACTTE|nr:protein canopy homolog 2-like [Actinia tenebrosa]
MELQVVFTPVLVILGLIFQVHCQRDKSFQCSVCQIAVDEIEWEISKVDPKKVIEVESFRVDPTGKQSYSRKIPYARSETHLTELLENICDNMKQYAESTEPDTGKKTYVRTSSHDGSPVNLSNISMSGEIAEKLKHTCEDILGEHDEEVIEVLKHEHDNQKAALCSQILHLCPTGDEAQEDGNSKEEL